jgi:hypothetical protein
MDPQGRPGLAEALIVWALWGLVALAVFITYWRIPPAELYNTSGTGPLAGASRLVVYLGYPVAIAAVPLAFVAAARLRTGFAYAAAAAATLLCFTIGFPGVIDQNDLDARRVNALAAAGVGIALALTVAAVARRGVGNSEPWSAADWPRALAAVVLLLAALPWIFAELGFYISDVPLLGSIFMAKEIVPSPGGEPSLHAVHLGSHHGMDGTVLAISALALFRVPRQLASRAGRIALNAYLSLLLVYGLANALQDFWTEQLVKRGTVSAAIPSLIRPSASWAWAAILVAALAICLAVSRVARVDPGQRGGG